MAFLTVLSLLLAVSDTEKLTVATALDLQKAVRPEYARPADWLDESRYVALDRLNAESTTKVWFAIDAALGVKQPLYLPSQFAAALTGLPRLDAAVVKSIAEGEVTLSPKKDGVAAMGLDDLFVWRFADRLAKRITDDAAEEEIVTFSPDGSRIAFVKENDLYVADVASGGVRALTSDGDEDRLCGKLDWVYQEEVYGRGNWKGYFWSPDSRRIACLVLDERDVLEYTIVDHRKRRPDVEVWRYPKAGDPNPRASLRILDVVTGASVTADLGAYADIETLLVRVSWQPDSSRVLLQVQNRTQTWLDLLAIDPQSGAATRLFRETTATFVEPTDAPIFAADGDEFFWLSERDGFRHLYVYANDGVLRRRLTEGEWEVDDVLRVTPDSILFMGDADDVKGAQLYRVPRAGGEKTKLTDRAGTHTVFVSPGATTIVTEWSSLTDPGDVRVLDANGAAKRTIATANKAPLEKHGIGVPRPVKITTRDGVELDATWIVPANFDPSKRYPAFQFAYAGPHAPQVLDRFFNRDVFWHHLLAQEGFHVLVCDNRSASGRGQRSVHGAYRKLYQSELRDLEDAAAWLGRQNGVDGSRIALHGWSYGGSITAYAMTHSKAWKVGIVGAPVTDWRLYDSIYTERYMGLPGENVEGYAHANIVNAAKDASGDMLLIHGMIDENVHVQNTLQFAEALQRANKPFSMMLYPGNRHSVADPAQKIHLFETMTRYLRQQLAPGT